MPGVYSIRCGTCDDTVAAEVLDQTPTGTVWLACPNCGEGSVVTRFGQVWPPSMYGSSIANLPTDVAQAWREARAAHAVAAYTGAEMMCRKILMHVAVDQGVSTAGKHFVEYVNDLDGAGYFSPGLKPIVDSVRDRGNTANHEIPASTEPDSVRTLKITEHLLRGIYELPAL
jgi:hypothetical protein